MADSWDWKAQEDRGEEYPDAGKIKPGLVSIIIPVYNWNHAIFHYTGNCIGSVREHTPKDAYELIVVDNGSTIKPAKSPSNDVDWKADKVITNESNLGVAKAWNQGIRVSQGEYTCLLNSDTMVFGNWLEDMRQVIESGKLDFVMSTPMYGDPYARAVESHVKRAAVSEDPITDFKDFACVMCRKVLFDDVGMFNEDFGLGYGEDMDFYKRMEKAGKKYGGTKLVNIFHIIQGTAYGMPEIPALMDRNRELLKEMWEEKPVSKAEVWGEGVPEAPVGQADTNSNADSPLARAPATGDKVFYVKDNKACWVTSPEVLTALGYKFGDVRKMTNEEFYQLQYGPQITMENVKEYAKV